MLVRREKMRAELEEEVVNTGCTDNGSEGVHVSQAK